MEELGGGGVRLQLFKGTYAILLCLAMAGLFLMLHRGAGDGFALLAWLGLVVLACGGLVATDSDLVAVVGGVVGLLASAYLEFGGALPASGAFAASGGRWRLEVTLGFFLLLVIALTVIWRARRRPV